MAVLRTLRAPQGDESVRGYVWIMTFSSGNDKIRFIVVACCSLDAIHRAMQALGSNYDVVELRRGDVVHA